MRSSRTARWLYRSSSRPGQATTISGPARSALICVRGETPPKTTAVLIRVNLARASISSLIWVASSRVGATISTRGSRPRTRRASRRSSDGSANAAVLPVPVWARPRMSRPSRAAAMVLRWIGRGSTNPIAAMPRWIEGPRSNSPNPVRGFISMTDIQFSTPATRCTSAHTGPPLA